MSGLLIRWIMRCLIHNVYLLHCHRICCYLTGTFVMFTAGVLDSFALAALFVAMTDVSLLYLIFQKGPDPPPQQFFVYGFQIVLEGTEPDMDVFYYTITLGDFRMLFYFLALIHTRLVELLTWISFIWSANVPSVSRLWNMLCSAFSVMASVHPGCYFSNITELGVMDGRTLTGVAHVSSAISAPYDPLTIVVVRKPATVIFARGSLHPFATRHPTYFSDAF